MKFIIGQRVRFLSEKGEGKITAILDKNTVEVDLGDDFPVEYEVNDLIPIDIHENILLPPEEVEKKKAKDDDPLPVRLGIHLMELSLAVCPSGADHFELFLANPEKWDILFTCYGRIRSKFEMLGAGKVASNNFTLIQRISVDQLSHLRDFHFQFLHYTTGSGMPQSPVEKNYTWKMEYLHKNSVFSELLQKDTWYFPLRDKNNAPQPVFTAKESDYIKLKNTPDNLPKGTKVVDLHIEKLVTDTENLDKAAMLFIQINAFEQAISDALVENYTNLVLIHGVGEGKLKSEIHRRLHIHSKVKSFKSAETLKYGNGATEVVLK
ncbi:MAG: Smr/MutS family protein [Bacteroidia bacterium]